MESSELVACNCKSFTYGFLGFRPTYHQEIKLNSNTYYMAVKKHQNQIISLLQICYKTTSGLKPKSMKTSDAMA